MKKIFLLMCCMAFAAQHSWVSAQTTTMKIWKDGRVTASYETHDVDSVTFETIGKIDLGGGVYLIDGHRFVDLGLPSGLLWAETNIGAETAADYGDYFAWGETSPQLSMTYNWSSYKYGTEEKLAKYNTTDSKTTLEKEDDAAYVNWGNFCRMPTSDDFKELLNTSNCTWTWTSMTTSSGSSIEGYKVSSTKNGNSIFLPASGYCSSGGYRYRGSYCCYWSSTLSDVYRVYALYSNSGSCSLTSGAKRYCGIPVRPVAEP